MSSEDGAGPSGTVVGVPGTEPGVAKTAVSAVPTANTDTLPAGSVTPSPSGSELPSVLPSVYAMGSEVARGGMGRILRAEDKRLRRPVAIKELLSESPSLRRRFEREALITARLQHPGIVPIYEAGTWPSGEPFYTMKLVAGRPLDQRIAEATALNDRIALLPNIIAMADAIAYAHSHHIIHRDLKPQNVLVGDFGETVVIDWGLAKDLDAAEVDELGPDREVAGDETVAGSVLGTPTFMPPEQARGEAVDARADVYGLGAVLYHALAKKPPYTGRTAHDIVDAVLAGPPRPLIELEPEVPPDLIAIVDKAMARDKQQRYPTAAELAEDLRRFQTGQLVGVHSYSLGQLLRRWVRRHRTAITVAACAVIALAIFGGIAIKKVLDANATAEHERDEARAAQQESERSKQAADRSHAAAEQSREQVASFMREQPVAMNHRVHTEMKLQSGQAVQCSTCHRVDAKTLKPVKDSPGHDQCAQCHERAMMEKDSKQAKCQFCHKQQARERAVAPRISIRDCPPDGQPRRKPCFSHEIVGHRFLDGARTKPVECGACHRVVTDKTRWGTHKFETLEDVRSWRTIGTTGKDDEHADCGGKGCHERDLELGRGANCALCHDEASPF